MTRLSEALRKRADWESTGGGCVRWLIFFACLLAAPLLRPILPPNYLAPIVCGILAFWIWWSLPFLGYRSNPLNLLLILIVIGINVAVLVTPEG